MKPSESKHGVEGEGVVPRQYIDITYVRQGDHHVGHWPTFYTLNHKKRDILFLTVTLASLNRFLWFLHHFNREEILHSTVVKICHITRFMCTPYLEKLKPTFCRDS